MLLLLLLLLLLLWMLLLLLLLLLSLLAASQYPQSLLDCPYCYCCLLLLQIWNFELSTVKPVVTHKANMKLSCLLFSPTSPVVVCGGENGSVSVFRLFNIDQEYDSLDEQLGRLEEVIKQNVMKTAV